MARVLWSAVVVIALLWPEPSLSLFDGIPLDRPAEAIVIGLIVPSLWWLNPRFLRTPRARWLVTTLLLWKLATGVMLTQQGWCGRFFTEQPQWVGGSRIQRSWDLRTDWTAPDPTCSAIVARPYPTLGSFPVWFINLIGTHGQPTTLERRPPAGMFTFEVDGYFTTAERGTLSLGGAQGVGLKGLVGPAVVRQTETANADIPLEAGVHKVDLEVMLTGDAWRFVPLWNERNLWSAVPTTVDFPSPLDRAVWKVGRLVSPILATLLILSWTISVVRKYSPNPAAIGWTAFASLAMGALAWEGTYERFAVLLVFGCLLVRVPPRLRNLHGALLLLGVPWLSFFAAKHFPQIGQVTFYSLGDDWLTFQRFAHRIFMEGYWLEGSEPTFWMQPLYRWIAGGLHVIFGDSSVGEAYWDASCLLVAALFCFHVVKASVGFGWGLLAGAATLATFALGPIWWLIGRGLSEISAAGWVYLGALHLLRSRLGRFRSCAVAGTFAILAFYTRLNHLPFVIALAALCLPLRLPAGDWVRFRSLLRSVSPRLFAVYLGVFAVGEALFALRTWYYTGVFSLFHGTQLSFVATGLDPTSIHRASAWGNGLESLWLVATVQDPPWNVRASLVSAGTVVAVLALLRMPLLRRVPLALSLLCLGALIAPLMVWPGGYPGRMSVHLVPIATAVSICALALATRKLASSFRQGKRARAAASRSFSPVRSSGPARAGHYVPEADARPSGACTSGDGLRTATKTTKVDQPSPKNLGTGNQELGTGSFQFLNLVSKFSF